ncbi:MAG: hypothetical protein ACE5LF_04610 [Alphaproteobacteria bacterium]
MRPGGGAPRTRCRRGPREGVLTTDSPSIDARRGKEAGSLPAKAPPAGTSEVGKDAPPRERRKTRLLLAYWERLRGARKFPALPDVDLAEIDDLWPHCVLVKVTGEPPRLEFEYVGEALKEGYELMRKAAICGMSQGQSVVGKVVSLAYEALEKRAPTDDSGSFCNQWGGKIKYRCIAVPLSADQQRIDYLLGLASSVEVKRGPAPGLTLSGTYKA